MEAVEVKSVLNLVPELLDVPYSRIWTVYDKEADVLYLNSKKPSHADDSELTDYGVGILAAVLFGIGSAIVGD